MLPSAELSRTEMKDAVKKFFNGDSVTDRELGALVDHFSHLEEALSVMGEAYWLPLKEVRMNLARAEGYLQNRSRAAQLAHLRDKVVRAEGALERAQAAMVRGTSIES